MVQGSVNPNITFLGKKLGVQEFFLQPIIKDRPNKLGLHLVGKQIHNELGLHLVGKHIHNKLDLHLHCSRKTDSSNKVFFRSLDTNGWQMVLD